MGENYQIKHNDGPHHSDQLLSSVRRIEESSQLAFIPNKSYVDSLKRQAAALTEKQDRLLTDSLAGIKEWEKIAFFWKI